MKVSKASRTRWNGAYSKINYKDSKNVNYPSGTDRPGDFTIIIDIQNVNYKTYTLSLKHTIAPKELTLIWGSTEFSCDKQSHVPKVTLSGRANSDTSSHVYVTVSGAQKDPGTYTATAALKGTRASWYTLPANAAVSFSIYAVPEKLEVGTSAYTLEDGVLTVKSGFFYDNEWLSKFHNNNNSISKVIFESGTKIYGSAENMFKGWTALESVDMRNLDISKVSSLANMFDGCSKLTEVLHNHVYSYHSNGSELIATCFAAHAGNAAGIASESENSTVYTLKAPAKTVYGDNNSQYATVTDADGKPYACFIEYYPKDSNVRYGVAPVTPGEYTAKTEVTMSGKSYALSVDYSIAQKEVSLTWTNTQFNYDGKSHVPTATASGLIGSDKCTVNVTGEQTNIGEYTATASSLSNEWYKLPENTTTSFSILAKVGTSDYTLEKISTIKSGTSDSLTSNVLTVKSGDFTLEQWREAFSNDKKSITHVIFEDGAKISDYNAEGMFADWTGLVSIDISNLDTSDIISMRLMFYNCTSLTELDLSNFDTSKVIIMQSMFYGCSSLEKIIVGDSWDMSRVIYSGYMFSGCLKLDSHAGTTYAGLAVGTEDEATTYPDVNGTYAKIDVGKKNPGLFYNNHEHNFTYSVDKWTITATCNAKGCYLDNNQTKISIVKPTLYVYWMDELNKKNGKYSKSSSPYATLTMQNVGDQTLPEATEADPDGKINGITIKASTFNDAETAAEEFKSITTQNISDSDIEYYEGDTKLESAPTQAGTYTAKITVGSVTMSVDYRIAQRFHSPVTVSPQAVPNLMSDGTSKELITSGEVYHVDSTDTSALQYALGNDATTIPTEGWSSDIPTVSSAGVYYVFYKVIGDRNHGDAMTSEFPSKSGYAGTTYNKPAFSVITITVPGITTAPAAKELTYNGQSQQLVTAGDAQSSTILYAIGTAAAPTSSYSQAIPTGTNAGTYYVWYKASSDVNGTISTAVSLDVKIQKAAASMAAPSAKTGLKYNASAQELVTAGTTQDGALYYALGNDDTTAPEIGYSTAIPAGTDEGTYYVWYKVSGDTNHNDTAASCVQVAIELKSYTISYNLQGGTATGNPTSYTMKSGAITLSNPERTGYNFTGWTGSNGTTPEIAITIPSGSTGSRNYTANWELVQYNISFDLNGGTISPDNPSSYNYETGIKLSNPTREGYEFAGWVLSGDDMTASTDLTIPEGSIGEREYIATWQLVIYTISYDLDGGTVSPDNPANYDITSEDIKLTNPERLGYIFDGWSFDNEISIDVTIPKGSTGDRTYTAIFTPIAYTITYNLDGGAASNPTSYTIESSDITLNIPEKAAYDFTGWSFDNEISIDVTIPKGSTGDRTYTAIFTPIAYTITYNLDGGTNNTDNPATYTIDSATIILKAPVREGYDFGGWLYDGEVITEIATGSSGDVILDAIWDTTPNIPSENTVVTTAEEISTMDEDELTESFSSKTDIILTGTVTDLVEVIKKLETVTTIEHLDLSLTEGLTEVKLDDSTSVKTLNVSGNQSITKIEVTGNTALTAIDIANTQVDTIYANGCKSLETVNTEGATSLVVLDVSETAITSLNVKDCAKLEMIDASKCENLSNINLEGCESLSYLNVNETQLTSLNVQDCVSLDVLYCASCDISDLNIEGCDSLRDVDCSNNSLRMLDAGNLANLRSLECRNQKIYGQHFGLSMNFNDFLRGSGRFSRVSAADDDSVSYLENVSNVKAYDESGNAITLDYDSVSGEVSFSAEPEKLTYDYDTGFENIKMDVTAYRSDEPGENGQTDGTPGDSGDGCGGGCRLGFGLEALAVMLLALTSKKR